MADSDDDSAGWNEKQINLVAKVILYGFGVVALVLGVVAAAFVGGGVMAERQALSNADATTDGTVVEMSIERVATRSDSADISDYEVRIEYRYTVAGTEYTGQHIYPTRTVVEMDTESDAEALLEPYEEGSTATVHYNPDEPEQAFLIAEAQPLSSVLGGVGATLVFLLAGAGAIWKGYGVGED